MSKLLCEDRDVHRVHLLTACTQTCGVSACKLLHSISCKVPFLNTQQLSVNATR